MDKQFINLSPVFSDNLSEVLSLQKKIQKALQVQQEQYKILNNNTYQIYTQFVKARLDEQRRMISEEGENTLSALFEVVEKINHDKLIMQYLIPSLDGILYDESKNVRLFLNINDQVDIFKLLKKIQLVPDYEKSVYESSFRITSILLSEFNDSTHLKIKVQFLDTILTTQREKRWRISDFVYFSCLIHLLKNEHLVEIFIQKNGQSVLQNALNQNSQDLQQMYYVLLSFWLLSYSSSSYGFFSDPLQSVITLIIQVVQKHSREKITRAAFQIFRNLAENSPSCIEMMVDVNLMDVIYVLQKGNFKDQDVLNDLEYVGGVLEKNLKVLSSFEKYQKEINTSQLDWSAVHTEKFWKENVKKFEANDFALIKKLVFLLESDLVQTQIVACYDIGEFCRFHPFGKNVIEKINGKDLLTQKAKSSSNSSVREQALLALQKLMINNWQAI